MTTKSILTACAALGLLGSALDLQAGERRFTYTYEATTAPKNSVELETWVTWKATRGGEDHGNQFDFRHELEIGVTDRLQLGLYLSDWSINESRGHTEADWTNVGAELIYNLSNPTTDFLGSALYFEVKAGDEEFALEGKILLQKNFGPWIVAYNAIVEAEWEGNDFDEEVGVFEQTLGVSYQISPKFSVGVEALHEIEFENWEEAGDPVVYVGPNASWRSGRVFATATGLLQATDIDEKPHVQKRLILGV